MSEEIIIDGVNVAGCEFLENDEFDGLCLQLYDRYDAQTGCKNKDCYYKQLQRLKKENEKLKKEVKQIGSAFIKKGDYTRELEKQLEFSRTHKSVINVEKIKYKQTLQKIKTIAKENLIGCFADECDLAREILDLITKAEEE